MKQRFAYPSPRTDFENKQLFYNIKKVWVLLERRLHLAADDTD